MMVGAIAFDASFGSPTQFPTGDFGSFVIPDDSGLVPLVLPEVLLRGREQQTEPSSDALRRFEAAMSPTLRDSRSVVKSLTAYAISDMPSEESDSAVSKDARPVVGEAPRPEVVKTEEPRAEFPNDVRRTPDVGPVGEAAVAVVEGPKVEVVTSERPAVVAPERPVIATSERPAVVTSERPAVVTSERPAVVTPERPTAEAVGQPERVVSAATPAVAPVVTEKYVSSVDVAPVEKDARPVVREAPRPEVAKTEEPRAEFPNVVRRTPDVGPVGEPAVAVVEEPKVEVVTSERPAVVTSERLSVATPERPMIATPARPTAEAVGQPARDVPGATPKKLTSITSEMSADAKVERPEEKAVAASAQVIAPMVAETPAQQTVQAAPEITVATAASARTEAIVETVNHIVEAVAGQILVMPGIEHGECEVKILLKPTVLDGSEIILSAKDGALTVCVTPATLEASLAVAAALPRLETALAEHAPAFRQVSVALATKKGSRNETV